jgi:hypothetical protein
MYENEKEIPQAGIEKEKHIMLDKNGNSVIIEEKKPGIFTVVGGGLLEKQRQEDSNQDFIGFVDWGSDVKNLDLDENQVPNDDYISRTLLWNGILMRGDEIHAPSIEKAQEALKQVVVTSYDPYNSPFSSEY